MSEPSSGPERTLKLTSARVDKRQQLLEGGRSFGSVVS